ncbi:MAG: folK [Betaproteobacteria bacterium]|nr:folK [Betaproteobacteria bacterium]
MTMTPVNAYVALGANLDDPVAQVKAGIAALATLPRTELVAQSSLYRTAPVGYADQPDFINAVAEVKTALNPRELLDALLQIEAEHGRVREFVNAPRTLDLDVLLYGEAAIDVPGLTIPHPRMHERAFVLAPLAEIAPQCIVPGHGRVGDLLQQVSAKGVTRLASAA